MEIEEITPTRMVKARKQYRDMCAEFILDYMEQIRKRKGCLTFKEWRCIAIAKANKWVISKGHVYEFTVLKYDDIYAFRNHIGLADICTKLELWPEL